MRLPLPTLSIPTWLLALSLACTVMPASLAWAHGGEDHGDTPAPLNTGATPAAPRTSARTDSFELVAVLQEAATPTPTLMLYLDRADTNTPVEGASIDVDSGAFKGTAKAIEPGIYTLPAGALAQAGPHALTITVQSADSADLMDATLDVGTPVAANNHEAPSTSPSTSRKAWLAAATLLLIALTWAWRRRSAPSINHDREAA